MLTDKINKYLDEAAKGPPEWKGRGPHKKIYQGMRRALAKYPDMPEDLRSIFSEVADYHEKESKKYTADDVFPKK